MTFSPEPSARITPLFHVKQFLRDNERPDHTAAVYTAAVCLLIFDINRRNRLKQLVILFHLG